VSKAEGDGMGARACLQLGQQATDVALDSLLSDDQLNRDFAVRQAVSDQLEDSSFAWG